LRRVELCTNSGPYDGLAAAYVRIVKNGAAATAVQVVALDPGPATEPPGGRARG
jgi:hypothetical protein